MKKLTIAAVLALGFAFAAPVQAEEAGYKADIYKNPQCGCCANYAHLMEQAGYEVTVHDSEDVVEMTETAGIPDEYQGCHLTRVNGYSFSGHVPLDIVEEVLNRKPAVKAFSLPGMPMGSPGMGGKKEEPFRVLGFKDGKAGVFAVE